MTLGVRTTGFCSRRENTVKTFAVCMTLAAAGCALPAPLPLDPSHPASPSGPEAPTAPPTGTLDGAAARPTSDAGSSAQQGVSARPAHEGHGNVP
jgi:hypothetical protein